MRQYTSRNPGLQLIIRDEIADYSVPGQKRLIKPVLTVEFGEYGEAWNPGEVTEDGRTVPAHHPFGNQIEFASFRGGLIDVDAMAEQKILEKNWDEEDAALVKETLERACDDPRHPFHGLIERHEAPTPVPPWPTYDEMHETAIPEQAQLLGLLPAALLYESQTHKREDVIARMNELAAQAEALIA